MLIALAPADDFRRDSDLFVERARARPRRSAGSGPRWGAGSRRMMEKWHCRQWSVTSPSIDTGGTTQLMNGQSAVATAVFTARRLKTSFPTGEDLMIPKRIVPLTSDTESTPTAAMRYLRLIDRL